MKTCTRCKQEKPKSEFYKKTRKNRSDGLRAWCKPCEKAADNVRFSSIKQKEKKAVYDREYREALGEKLKKKYRDYYAKTKPDRRAKVKAWQLANPGKHNGYSAQGKVAKLRASPPWVNRAAILSVYEKAKIEGMDVDHIIPLRHHLVCGLHVPWNLQLLTKTENCSKKNRFEVITERGVPLQR